MEVLVELAERMEELVELAERMEELAEWMEESVGETAVVWEHAHPDSTRVGPHHILWPQQPATSVDRKVKKFAASLSAQNHLA
jgi:hypothetical protein